MKVLCVFSLESPHRGDKKDNHPKLSQSCFFDIFFERTQERVRNSRDKRAISVQATEGPLYLLCALRVDKEDM